MLLGIIVDASLTGGDVLPSQSRAARLGLFGIVLALFAASGLAAAVARAKDRLRTLRDSRASPKRGLVILVSDPSLPLEGNADAPRVGSVVLRGESLEADIRALNAAHWNWQQLLRGLEPHQASLRAVYLIGSSDTEGRRGSFHALPQAKTLVEFYCRGAEVKPADVPVDFEYVDGLVAALGEGVLFLEAKGLRQGEISIDVTGGQKPTSIAGAVVTLNTNVHFQYVQTNQPFGIREYDLAMVSGRE